MLQAELVPRIHPFRRECGADSSSSDLHSGNMISAPASCLLTEVGSAMAGFCPDSFRCFGTVLCAQLRSSGFPFLLRRCLQKHAPATVHRMAYSEIFTAKKYTLRFPWLLYTIYPQFASNSALLRRFFSVFAFPKWPCILFRISAVLAPGAESKFPYKMCAAACGSRAFSIRFTPAPHPAPS